MLLDMTIPGATLGAGAAIISSNPSGSLSIAFANCHVIGVFWTLLHPILSQLPPLLGHALSACC